MRLPRRPEKFSTPLDARQKSLLDQQEKLRAEQEKLEQLIAEAPARAKQQDKRRREELLDRYSHSVTRLDANTLQDTRYLPSSGQTAPRRTRKALKAERREARVKFLVLFLIVTGLIIWVVRMMPW